MFDFRALSYAVFQDGKDQEVSMVGMNVYFTYKLINFSP